MICTKSFSLLTTPAASITGKSKNKMDGHRAELTAAKASLDRGMSTEVLKIVDGVGKF